MKKFFLFLAACAMSIATFAAASITASDVDFGTVSIKGESFIKDSTEIHVSWSDMPLYTQIETEVYDTPSAEDCKFELDPTYVWTGSGESYDPIITSYDFKLIYTAFKAGTFTCNIKFYGQYYDEGTYHDTDSKIIHVTLTVTNDAVVAQVVPFERVEKTADLADGDTIVFVCESENAVCGPLEGTALSSITENVKLTNGQAEIPLTAQMFKATKYSGGWQFYTADSDAKRLHLDIASNNAKGAFTYDAAQGGSILATWGVEISNGVATVQRANEEADYLYPVYWASGSTGGRFKPYKNASGSEKDIAIYKKKGQQQDVQSIVSIDPATINFGDVASGAEKEITISYTGEYLEDDIVWAIEGDDAAEFELKEGDYNDRKEGTLTITYKGQSTKTGALTAELAYLTADAKKDLMGGSFPISINLVKLDGIQFKKENYEAKNYQELDLSDEVAFNPTSASNTGLVWKLDKSYYGSASVSDAGVFKATATGDYKVVVLSALSDKITDTCTISVTLPEPESVELSETSITLHVGEQKILTASVKPDGTDKKPVFESDKTDIATVDKDGKITAKALGTATISVSATDYPAIQATCTVNVEKWAVTALALPETADLTLGSTLQLDPTFTPAAAKDEYEVTYSSNNEEVAKVDQTGLVTSVAEGEATITAVAGGKSAEITIHVVAPVMFEKATSVDQLGAKDTIILATIYKGNGIVAGPRNNKVLTVLTNNLKVTETEAYADDAIKLVLGTLNGKEGYTLHRIGQTNVLAENNNDLSEEKTSSTKNLTWQFIADGTNGIYVQNVGNSNAMFKYNSANNAIKPYRINTADAVYVYVYFRKYVQPAAESVSLNKTELDMHIGDQDVKLKASVMPEDADQTVTWTSSAPSVASVDENGWVKAVGEGTATITATVTSDPTLTATCEVSVSEWTVESLTLDVDEETIKVGEQLRINATVLPTEHKFDVDFYTSNAEIATVTIGGLVTGVAVGDVTITAKAGTKEATALIHVEANEEPEPDDQAIDDVNAQTSVQKIVRDGQVYILRNGVLYTVTGAEVRE
ncbi:MAG: Ig-like domain-containing protein [Paludibacteraceae bacterium]